MARPTSKNKVEDPCERCREHHLKCDENHPCTKCERLGAKCHRETGAKFRHGSSAKYDKTFKKDQTWLGQTKRVQIQFVDQTTEVERHYASEDPEQLPQASSVSQEERDAPEHVEQMHPPARPAAGDGNTPTPSDPPMWSPNDIEYETVRPESEPSPKRQRTGEHNHAFVRDPDYGSQAATPLISEFASPSTTIQSQHGRLPDSAAAVVPSLESGMLSPKVWKESFFWPNAYTTTQCLCLMRYYIQHLAPWFDISDPARHFTLVVPQHARRCPPLLHAVFTAAARHLARMSKYRTADGTVRYAGTTLPLLTTATAISYQTACIAYLIELSKDSREVGNDDLLAAAVILRYYEELDTSITGKDAETFLHTFQVFIKAQKGTVFDGTAILGNHVSSGNIGTDLTITNTASSFRDASFRMALRQEVTSAFMKQRSVRLPLDAWESLRSWEEAEDAVWLDRLVLFCADVLQFCFGHDASGTRTQTDRWNELKGFESMWELCRPRSFEPLLHNQETECVPGQFPEIWLFSEVHACGLQYLDLARILLTVYDPQVPRLGPGSIAATRRISATVREIVLRICGIAVSNGSTQPGLVMAHMAIAVCGEYFTNRREQDIIIDLLKAIEAEHAWPTAQTVGELKLAWSWE